MLAFAKPHAKCSRVWGETLGCYLATGISLLVGTKWEGPAHGLSAKHRNFRSTRATLGKAVNEVWQNTSLMATGIFPFSSTARCPVSSQVSWGRSKHTMGSMKCGNHPEEEERNGVDCWGRKRKVFYRWTEIGVKKSPKNKKKNPPNYKQRMGSRSFAGKYWGQVVYPTI